ncbi:unnamed protein product [Eruca vesicaria subsp. sativa]|uniref:KIB1-4 beta-propeller domain-containing protein n=1 Tax=Eruca vesicaria subsp. sativa TaxID=29727 RepID=A0ABC8IRI2_ERUVS|nr:unnamed protein product [Eruca vesicaria subsp. sativa]
MRTRRRNYTTATKPSSSLPEALTVKPIVPVSGTKRIQSCNAKYKRSKKKKSIATGLWDLHIPTEILEIGITPTYDHLMISRFQASLAEDDWNLNGNPYLLDPLNPHHPSQKYKLTFPYRRFKPDGKSYSKDGWVLAKLSTRMDSLLFNPFTNKLFCLPNGSLYHSRSRLAFSAAPTSTSCVVISYARVVEDFLIETWRPGEDTWTTHRFDNSFRGWDKCVFSNGVFYFLSTCGCLGVFDPCEATCKLLPVKPYFSTRSWILQCSS